MNHFPIHDVTRRDEKNTNQNEEKNAIENTYRELALPVNYYSF